VYYIHQAVCGLTTPGNGPVYPAPLYFQREHVIGNTFGIFFRWVRPLLWSGTKAVGRKSLHTVGKINTDIAESKPTDATNRGHNV